MDAESARRMLAEFNEQIETVKRERDALLDIITGLEGLLGLHADDDKAAARLSDTSENEEGTRS